MPCNYQQAFRFLALTVHEVFVITRPVTFQGASCERVIRAFQVRNELHICLSSNEVPGLFTGSVRAKRENTRRASPRDLLSILDLQLLPDEHV